jgi:hypothetical protein
MTYVNLLYQDLMASGQYKEKPLPQVQPLVVYTGKWLWKAFLSVTEMLDPDKLPEMDQYISGLSYRLLEVWKIPDKY